MFLNWIIIIFIISIIIIVIIIINILIPVRTPPPAPPPAAVLVHAITFEQHFGFLSFLARLLALTYKLPD